VTNHPKKIMKFEIPHEFTLFYIRILKLKNGDLNKIQILKVNFEIQKINFEIQNGA
jgi:hypothetical protein